MRYYEVSCGVEFRLNNAQYQKLDGNYKKQCLTLHSILLPCPVYNRYARCKNKYIIQNIAVNTLFPNKFSKVFKRAILIRLKKPIPNKHHMVKTSKYLKLYNIIYLYVCVFVGFS